MMKKLAALAIAAASFVAAQVPLPYPIFDKDAVHEIKLTFPNADWFEVLTANYDGVRADNPYFPAKLEWGAYTFDQIGVRFKGNSTYSSARTPKKPFRLKLNEFVKGQKIEGIGSFSLSNGWNDPSFVREKLYYEMAASLGVKAPRSNYAALTINGQYWGLYMLTEVINSDFLKNYFGKGNDEGNLYKGNIGANFGYLGEDKTAYKTAWEKQTNEEADDWADLIALCKLINETPAAEFKQKIEAVMDVDSVLAALALDNATVNLDSYVGMGQNFNIYQRASDKRWVWIPWDPSLAFGALSQGQTIDGMKTLALEWVNTGGFGGGPGGGGMPPGGLPPGGMPPGGLPPGGLPPAGGGGGTQVAGRPLASKLWEVPEYKERYRQIYVQLMAKAYDSEKVVARANALRDLIRPWVEKDTQKLVSQADFDNAMTAETSGGVGGGGQGGPQGGIPGLGTFIQARGTFVNGQLEEAPVSRMALQASNTSIAFATGGSQELQLSLNGSSTQAFYALRTLSEGNWLTVTPADGPVGGAFKVSASGKLEPGTYTGRIQAYSPGAINSPLEIVVTYTVQ